MKHIKFLNIFIFILISIFLVSCKSKVSFTGLSIESNPTKIMYYVGENFDSSGLQISALFSNKTKKDVTSDIEYSKAPLVLNQTSVLITVKINGTSQSVSVSIVVLSIDTVELVMIEIREYPDKLIYFEGEFFDPSGLVVEAYYSDETVIEITNYTFSKETPLVVADNKIIIYYTENNVQKQAIINIYVEKVVVLGIVVTYNSEVIYHAGDIFNQTGLIVEEILSDNSRNAVTNYQVISPVPLISGVNTITIKYILDTTTYTKTIDIFVLE